MGTMIEISCPGCGYRKELFTGGGFVASYSLFICNDCNEVTAVLTALRNRSGERMQSEADPEIGICKHCKGRNLVAWEDNVCPKCGSTMKESVVGMWD